MVHERDSPQKEKLVCLVQPVLQAVCRFCYTTNSVKQLGSVSSASGLKADFRQPLE